jgi:hypothetical protein
MLQIGHGFESPMRSAILSMYLIFPATLGPGVTQPLTEMSARNRKEMSLGSRARAARKARLTTSPLSLSLLSRQCGILNISQPYRPPRSVIGIALLYGDGVCFL